MQKLLSLPGREIFRLDSSINQPSVYYILDNIAGGILINTPLFSHEIAQQMIITGGVKYIFLPSYLGAHDIAHWRDALNAETLAAEAEISALGVTVDIAIDAKTKLTRTIDFLTMAGRTRGSCALRLKNLPGVVFFGPILATTESGWPGLVACENDFSFETRLIGALALQDLKFEYAFTDDYQPGISRFGPDASKHINAEIEKNLNL